MNWFSHNYHIDVFSNILKTAGQNLIQGPAVDQLINAVHSLSMVCDGAASRDNQGFCATDLANPAIAALRSSAPGSPVSIENAAMAMRAIIKYKTTQLASMGFNYDSIRSGIEGLIRQQSGNTNGPADLKTVTVVGPGDYGKIRVVIPNFNSQRKINDAVRKQMAAFGIKPELNRLSGKMELPAYKAFGKSAKGLDEFSIDPKYIPAVSQELLSLGYNADQLNQYMSQIDPPEVQQSKKENQPAKTNPAKKITATPGPNNTVALTFPFNQQLVDAIKSSVPGNLRQYDKATKEWTVLLGSPASISGLKQFANMASGLGFDATDVLGAVSDRTSATAPETDQLQEDPNQKAMFKFKIRDVSTETGGRWHLGVGFLRKNTDEGEDLKKILRYSFVDYGNLDTEGANRSIKKNNIGGREIPVETFLAGKYINYVNFYTSLKNRNFDTTELVSALQQLIKKGIIIPDAKKPGDFDGYGNFDNFVKATEEFEKNAGFKFTEDQKNGMGFLYSHNSAILGDSTGLGKTVQTIVAASLRMKQSGGRCLVVCPNSTKTQWIEQIGKIAKAEPGEISTDPTQKAKWVVTHYENFSVPSQRAHFTNNLLQQAQAGEFSCFIIDEIHMIKNGKPNSRKEEKAGRADHASNHRTFNIQDVAKHIPNVYGASATVIANEPIDVFNQLKAVNSPLGQMKYSKFMKEFGGAVLKSTPRGMVYAPGNFENIFEAVQELKEFMIDQRLYLARIYPDGAPKANTSDELIEVDSSSLYKKVSERLNRYKNPNEPLPITEMTAFRTEVAISKAPRTVQDAIKVLMTGKKVAMFTNFNEARTIMVQGVQDFLNKNFMGKEVVHISGGQSRSQRDAVIKAFKDPNSKAVAIVINIAAGGTGLDFPNVVEDVIVNDYDWSPAKDKQAKGRFLRINSENDINIKYQIAAGTEDEEIYARVKEKIKISNLMDALSAEQMNLILKGHRRGSSKKLKELEAKMKPVVKRYIELEEDEKGEEAFHAMMANKIKNKISGGDKEEELIL